MPCRSDYMESSVDYAAEAEKERKKLIKLLDEVTRHLCLTCKTLTRNGISIPRFVQSWWEEHQEVDRKRLIAERLKKVKRQAAAQKREADVQKRTKALGKLTPAERKLLKLS